MNTQKKAYYIREHLNKDITLEIKLVKRPYGKEKTKWRKKHFTNIQTAKK